MEGGAAIYIHPDGPITGFIFSHHPSAESLSVGAEPMKGRP